MANNNSYKTGKTEFDKACRIIDCGYNEPKKQQKSGSVKSGSDNTGVILIVAVVAIVVICKLLT